MAVDPARVKSLFLNAADQADLAKRAAYLDRQCGDDAELRARVEALLNADAESENDRIGAINQFEPTLISGSTPQQPDQDREHNAVSVDSQDFLLPPLIRTTEFRPIAVPGVIIAGRYSLVEKIGEGGMGEVWVCQQTEPVKRKVALKLIKTGMDSKAVVQRFEQERQALALMEHPNIARVLDGGLTPNGQPFFVMELVNGLALNKFCDTMKLTLKQRLELFVPICQAVQHAHQKGIVHRDLKPPNILVTMIDGHPVPKVIDFGVAKATAGKLTEETMSTGFGAVIGTLEYMSPEQAGLSGDDIDTRADIYSLGVILYELLTGLRPIDTKRLRKAALGEMIRIIQEEEPSKPSTRLSTDAALPSHAALRQTEPKKLMAILRGDLDWVVMKCLEKQRDRRYETASGLARDIQRYLDDEVVEARPPGTAYRIKKFVRRHKGQVIAAGFVLLALTAGVIGTTIGLIRAEEQRRLAVAAQLAEEERADGERRARADADIARSRAEDQERLANRRFYNGQIALTSTAVQSGQPTRALDFLETLRPRAEEEDLRGFEWYHLWNLLHRDRTHILPGHHSGSARVSVSPDGKTIATGDVDGVVSLWNAETGRLVQFWQAATAQIFCHAFSESGKLLACGSTDRRVTIWDIRSGEEVGSVVLEASCSALVWLPKREMIAAACENGTIHLLDQNGRRQQSFRAQENLFINRLLVDAHGRLLLSIQRSYEKGTMVFDLATMPPSPVRQLPPGFGASVTPDGRTLAVAHYNDIHLWEVSTGVETGRLSEHNGAITALAFSPDGTRLLSGGLHDRSVILWDVADQKQIGRWASGFGVTDIQFVSGGTGWAVSGMGENVELWKAGGAHVTDQPQGPLLGRAIIAPDGKTLLISGEGPLRRWDLVRGVFVEPLPPMGSLMGLSRDGTCALSTIPPTHAMGYFGDTEIVAFDELSVWDVATCSLRFKLRMTGKSTGASVLAPDGTWAAAGNDASEMFWWDISGKELGAPVAIGGEKLGCLGASSDSTTLAVGDELGLVRLWNARTRSEVGRFQHGPVALSSIAFSPNDSLLATADEAGTIHLWEPKTLRHLGVFAGDIEIMSMTFFPDNRTLACGRADGTIQLVDVSTYQERMVWKAHQTQVLSLAVTPDGGTIVSRNLNGEMRVWRTTMSSDATARKSPLIESSNTSPPPAVLWPTGRPF